LSSASRSRLSKYRGSCGSWAGGEAGARAMTLMAPTGHGGPPPPGSLAAPPRGGGGAPPRGRAPLPREPETRGAEGLLKAPGVGLLGLREGLEPLRDVVEALVARLLGHARVHRLVLVRLAGNGALEVLLGVADRQARRRVAHLLQEVEVPVRVPG